MTTIKLKIDERNKTAKAFLEYIKTLSFVKIEEEEPQYNPEFIKKIERSRKEIENGDYVVLDTNNVWKSLGL